MLLLAPIHARGILVLLCMPSIIPGVSLILLMITTYGAVTSYKIFSPPLEKGLGKVYCVHVY